MANTTPTNTTTKETPAAPTQVPSNWKSSLDNSPYVRSLLIFSFFALYFLLSLTSVAADAEHYTSNLLAFVFAQLFALLVIFTSMQKKNALSNKRLFVIWGAALAQLFAIQFLSHYFLSNMDSGEELILLTLPYILAPMITTVLLGRRMGVFTTYLVSFFAAPLLPQGMAMIALTISLIAGSIAVVATFRTRSRGQLLKAGLYSGLGVLIICMLYGYLPLPWENSKLWVKYAIALLACPTVAILLSGIFPILESIFSITTLTGWLERSDLNNKILRQLQLEAPGTFHHSLMVAQLSEAAAEAIGANALECRVCSYYHDIGKLTRPEYFTENMVDKENSPHNSLTPLMSAKILMKHVEDGVVMAKKNNLERHIIATIQEHHGTSMVSFLYQKALIIRDEMMEKVEKGLANEEDIVYPEESQFRYSGPIPQSRETAIISLADAVESASRSLHHPTEEDIQELVERIVRYRVNEGQLDECGLTLGEIKTIKGVFLKTIKSMLHSRISYPKSATTSDEEKPPTEEESNISAEEKQPLPAPADKEETPKEEEISSPTKNIESDKQENNS